MSDTSIVNAPATKKVNNVKCRRIPNEESTDTRPTKGHEMCQHLYGNIFLCAKKNKGKTTVIWNFIQRCAGRDTIIVAFVSTLNNDKSWIQMRGQCEEQGKTFIGFTSLVDENGEDQLANFIEVLKKKAGDPDALEVKEEPLPRPSLIEYGSPPTPSESKAERKPRRTPYQAPEYIIILDDLSEELKKKSVASLLKKNRHYKCKVIISSQWLNDLAPDALRQMNVVCLFQGFSVDKLEEFYAKANLGIPFEQFHGMYNDATKEDYSFLYVDTDNGIYRKKFDREYQVE